MKPRIGFIIPTMNRIQSLNRLLDSVYSQSLKPDTVIIVDGSDHPIEPELRRDDAVKLIYVREHPPSLTRQRNAGIRAIPEHLTHVGFLDDDLVLLPGCIEAMGSFIARHDDTLGGAGFNIQDKPPGRLRLLSVFMGHSSMTPGKIRSSGYPTSNIGAKTNYYSEWLCGGATVWKKSVLDNYSFDEWFKGYALWEDVDFSYRVSRSMKLAVVADAKVLHLHVNNTSPERSARIGDLEIVDRFYFITKHHSEMSVAMATWASLGTIARNLLIAARYQDRLLLIRAQNNFKALLRCVRGDISRGY
jgi:GT2 family glycosyltransferase